MVYVSAEFGGIVSLYINDTWKEFLDRELVISSEIKKKLISEAKQFKDFVFVDTEKQTIFTIQGNHGIDEKEFQRQKENIAANLKNIIKDYPEFEVQTDRLAVNVRYKIANKKLATDIFLKWVQNKGFDITKYYVFGDSPSDLEMGEELQHQKLEFDFIFVGEQDELQKGNYSFPIILTKGHCDKGTLEYLKENNLP